MTKEAERTFTSYDFVIDTTTDEQKRAVGEWSEENQGKCDVFNPNWEHLERVANNEKNSPKTVILTDKEPSLDEAMDFIGGFVEIIQTRTGAQLIVDEAGGLKGLPTNSIASQILGALVCGPAMILRGEAKWK
tara:strand:- start:3936 stop:4334 length:399 start_codon:yes stop_codon:yes gene_type:complete